MLAANAFSGDSAGAWDADATAAGGPSTDTPAKGNGPGRRAPGKTTTGLLLAAVTSCTESSGQWAALAEADHELMLADMLADSARRRPEDWLNDQQSQDAMLHFLGGFAERLTPHPEVILHMLADVLHRPEGGGGLRRRLQDATLARALIAEKKSKGSACKKARALPARRALAFFFSSSYVANTRPQYDCSNLTVIVFVINVKWFTAITAIQALAIIDG